MRKLFRGAIFFFKKYVIILNKYFSLISYFKSAFQLMEKKHIWERKKFLILILVFLTVEQKSTPY